MFIVLIQPLTHGRSTVRPLGLGYLSSALLQKGHKVRIIDNDIYKMTGKELAQKVISLAPDIAGITTNILNKWNALELGNLLSKDIMHIAFGGAQASLFPEWFLKKKNFFALRGEGEKNFALFAEYVSGSRPIEEVKGLSFINDSGVLVNNPPQELEENLDNILFPNTDLFEMDKYRIKFEGEYSTNIISSRGCPFKCIFCYHRLNGKFRQRSPENVIKEITLLKNKYGYGAFKFFDDNFTLRKKFVIDLSEKLIKEKTGIYWQCLSSSRNVDEEMLRIMYRSGCRQISFGIESGSEKSLKLMGKSATVEHNKKAIALCRKIGIRSKAYITIGYPWETKDDFKMTCVFLRKNPPDFVQAFLVFPFPKTDLENMVKERGSIIDYDALRGARDLNIPCFETDDFKKSDLIDWRSRIMDEHKRALTSIKFKKVFYEFANIFKKR